MVGGGHLLTGTQLFPIRSLAWKISFEFERVEHLLLYYCIHAVMICTCMEGI